VISTANRKDHEKRAPNAKRWEVKRRGIIIDYENRNAKFENRNAKFSPFETSDTKV
tara:strand:- start:147 stop:314 length:168 start_codon:yes stop_codon:yes gene_type:complete